MNRPLPGILLLASLVAAPLSAQNGREHFITPDSTSLDPVRAEQQQAYLNLRDSVSAISSAGARLMSDMTSSSSLAWMQARAKGVAAACERTSAPLMRAKALTESAVWTDPERKQAQASILKAMPGFAREMTDCQKRWTSLAADTSQVFLRENAPYQMKVLQDKVSDFNQIVGTYLRYISIKLPVQSNP